MKQWGDEIKDPENLAVNQAADPTARAGGLRYPTQLHLVIATDQ